MNEIVGTSVCNGDSGGSMTFEKNGVYYIRGIVSVSVSRTNQQLCDPKHYVIFTDVAQFIPWIEDVVPQLKPLVQQLGNHFRLTGITELCMCFLCLHFSRFDGYNFNNRHTGVWDI